MRLSEVDRTAFTRTVAVMNGKGGVFKTTLVANAAGLLALSGFQVLAIDLDPQGNLSDDLGITGTEVDDEGLSFARALSYPEGAELPRTRVRPDLDLVVGGHHLEGASATLVAKSSKDPHGAALSLAELIQPLALEYDMILIDCPPGNEPLQRAAAAAGRWIIVPVKSDASSRKGLLDVARRVDGAAEYNSTLELLGVVLVGIGSSAHRVQEEARKQIGAVLGTTAKTLTATVRHSEATAQAARDKGVLVHELDDLVRKGPEWWKIRRGEAVAERVGPRTATSVADDLQSVTTEIMARIQAAEAAEAGEQ